jgi:hypothetical protein
MRKTPLLLVLVTLGVLASIAPALAQSQGGPPDGTTIQAPPPPPPTEAVTVGYATVTTGRRLAVSTRAALGLWIPSLLRTGPLAVVPARGRRG